MTAQSQLCQIALSVADVRRTQSWYRDVFGLVPAGGTNLFAGPLASMVQGVPRSASTCWWLIDSQDFFQLEFFEFRSPPTRPLRADWLPSDIGLSMLCIHVADLDGALAAAEAAGSPALTPPVGPAGARRACVRDPDGVLIELMEDDPRAPEPRARPRSEVPATVRAVTMSVPDLERATEFYVTLLGLTPHQGDPLHTPAHEAAWGLEGAVSHRVALWAGDMLVELAQYETPTPRTRPDGQRVSDIGLSHIAFGQRDRTKWEAQLKRCRTAGLRGNGPPLRVGSSSVTYLNDPDGFTIELLHCEQWMDKALGFTPRATPRIAPFAGRNPSVTRRDNAFKKAVITGGAGRICGELAAMCADDGTELVLIDRDAEGLERIAETLRARVQVDCIAVDLSDLEAVEQAARQIVERHPDHDLLIAGAGVDRGQSMLNFDWRQARDDFNINTLANLVLFEHLLPPMRERGNGHVTAIASLAALIGTPYEGVYSATKAALGRLVESARGELRGTGVTFTTAYPGFIDTPLMWANAYKHPYVVPLRDAAERIYEATLARRATLHFPLRERLRITGGQLLPATLRDRMTKDAMDPESAAKLAGDR